MSLISKSNIEEDIRLYKRNCINISLIDRWNRRASIKQSKYKYLTILERVASSII